MINHGATMRFHCIKTLAEATEGDRDALHTCNHSLIEVRSYSDVDDGMLSLGIEPRTGTSDEKIGLRHSSALGLTLTLDFTLKEAAGLLHAMQCLIEQARWYRKHPMPAAADDLEAELPP